MDSSSSGCYFSLRIEPQKLNFDLQSFSVLQRGISSLFLPPNHNLFNTSRVYTIQMIVKYRNINVQCESRSLQRKIIKKWLMLKLLKSELLIC